MRGSENALWYPWRVVEVGPLIWAFDQGLEAEQHRGLKGTWRRSLTYPKPILVFYLSWRSSSNPLLLCFSTGLTWNNLTAAAPPSLSWLSTCDFDFWCWRSFGVMMSSLHKQHIMQFRKADWISKMCHIRCGIWTSIKSPTVCTNCTLIIEIRKTPTAPCACSFTLVLLLYYCSVCIVCEM